MNSLFEALCDAMKLGQRMNDHVANHLPVLNRVRSTCKAMHPGMFTSEMVFEQVVTDFPEITRHDIRRIMHLYSQDGVLVEIGSVRQGHVSVPAYRCVVNA